MGLCPGWHRKRSRETLITSVREKWNKFLGLRASIYPSKWAMLLYRLSQDYLPWMTFEWSGDKCKRSDVVIFWPVLWTMSPFQLMGTSYIAENTTSLKNLSGFVSLVRYSIDHGPDSVYFWPRFAQGMSHNPSKVSARSTRRFGSYFRKKLPLGCITPPPLHVDERVNFQCMSVGSLKELVFKYCWTDQPKA